MATNSGRVEIKFMTDTKELENAKKAINDLGSNLNKALDASLDSSVNKAMTDLGREAEHTSEKVDSVTTSVDKLETETNQLANAGGDMGGVSDGIEDIGDKSDKSTGGVKNLVSALGLLKVAGVTVNMITNSIDDAIGRVDTMRQFPKMMQQVGFTAEETEQSIDRLSQGIQGLPTRLNDVVATTQQIALTTGDLNKATEITLALNNAFLASGSAGADASRGLQQFSQMLSSGVVDMQSWRTLLETMPLALQTVAENFGYTGAAAKNDLYTALQEGVITFDDFTNAIIEANNAQGGFAELALTGSEGIATSFQNIRTAVVNGVSKVIEALDELVEELTGKNIAQNFDQLKNVIGSAFSTISSGIRSSTPYIRQAINLFKQLSPAIGAAVSAYAGIRVVQTASKWIEGANEAIEGAQIAKNGLTIATKALTTAEGASATALKASHVVYGVLNGQISAMTARTALLTAAKTALLGPMGIAIGLAIAVGGAYLAVSSATKELVDENKELVGTLEDTNTKNDDLKAKMEESKGAYEDQIESINNNRDAQRELVDEIDALMQKESLSADEKATLRANIDELNASIGETVLKYDEETGAVDGSISSIRKRIDALEDQETAEAALQRRQELRKEIVDINAQIAETEQKILEGRQAMQDMDFIERGFTDNYNNTRTAVEELEAQYEGLIGQRDSATEQMEYTTGVYEEALLSQSESMDAMAQATEESTQRQIVAYEDMSDAQKAVIDDLTEKHEEYRNIATDMFSQVEAESETSVSEMIANLEHNQQALATYAENMTLIRDAVSDLDPSGEFLSTLEALGPSAAGEVANIASSIGTDDFATLVETFTSGGEEATEALLESLGIEQADLPEGLTDLISNIEESISEQLESSELDQVGGILVEKISEGMEEASTESIQGSFGNIIEKVPEWLDEGTDIVKQAGSDIVENVSTGVSEAGTETMSTAVQSNVVDPVPAKVEESAETFSNAGTSIVDNIASGMENTEKISSAVESSISELPTKVDETVPEMETAGGNLMQGAQTGVDNNKQNFVEAVGSSATEALDSFNSNSGNNSPSVLYAQAAADIVAGAVNGINDNKASLNTATGNMAKEAIQAFINNSEGAYSAGAQLGAGFREGLASMRNSIVNTATGIANAASAAINEALIVRSPSRKGVYSGSMLVQGVEVGMKDRLTYLDKMAKRVADTATPEMKPIDIQRALDMPRFSRMDNSPIGATTKASDNRAMTELLGKLANKDIKVYLDNGVLVGEMAPEFDRVIGNIAKDKSRYG